MGDKQELLFLDISGKNTGIADGPINGKPTLSSLRVIREGETPRDGCVRLARWIAARIEQSRPRAIYFEEPVNAAAKRGSFQVRHSGTLHRLVGAVEGVCGVAEIPCHGIGTSTYRKWFLGRGNLKTEVAKPESARIARLLGCDPRDLDQADACAGWYFSASLFDSSIIAPSRFWEGELL